MTTETEKKAEELIKRRMLEVEPETEFAAPDMGADGVFLPLSAPRNRLTNYLQVPVEFARPGLAPVVYIMAFPLALVRGREFDAEAEASLEEMLAAFAAGWRTMLDRPPAMAWPPAELPSGAAAACLWPM